jgi:hypothetical protein
MRCTSQIQIFFPILLIFFINLSDCLADDKKQLLINGIGLGKVKLPCQPKPVEYQSSYDGHIEKILLKCTLRKERDSTEITFSADGKRVVRVLREQYLRNTDPYPADIIKAAINFYGTPREIKPNSYAIYGDAHYCDGCVTDLKVNDYGTGLVVCNSSGWNIGRRIFSNNDHGVVYELVNMPELIKANKDGEQTAQKYNQKKLSKQRF